MTKSTEYFGYAIGGPKNKTFESVEKALEFYKTNGIMCMNIEHKEHTIGLNWFHTTDYEFVPVTIYK